MENYRKLKIYTKYQARLYRGITTPEIKLAGKWLEKLGFNEGQTINIEQKKNKLIITIDKGQK